MMAQLGKVCAAMGAAAAIAALAAGPGDSGWDGPAPVHPVTQAAAAAPGTSTATDAPAAQN